MHINRFARTLPISPRKIALLLAGAGLIAYFLYIPPVNAMVIAGGIAAISIYIYILLHGVIAFHWRLGCVLFTAIFLTLNWLVGYNIVNTILLASAIIAVCAFISYK